MVLPILLVAGIALIAVPYMMARELMDNELLIIVAGICVLAYILKVAK